MATVVLWVNCRDCGALMLVRLADEADPARVYCKPCLATLRKAEAS